MGKDVSSIVSELIFYPFQTDAEFEKEEHEINVEWEKDLESQ
jgi:hypothetical protein